MEALKSKAGSDGAALSKARRAFEKLSEFARERGVPNHGLPANAVFVFTFLRWIDAKALQKGTGTQGGAHVSASTRAGLLILADHFGLQIAVHTLVPSDAAAVATAQWGRKLQFRGCPDQS